MCGFVAMLTLDCSLTERATIERIIAVLKHRGPDGAGTYLSGPVGLGFRRLAILDLSSSGHQPKSTEDEQYTIVFNGEIYNYIELRDELEALGYNFKSSGDTEVLLRAYCAWGIDCLKKLNGMWAFVIYDKRQGKLFGARDRFGIKPLYRYNNGSHVLFSSEIKGIRASGLYRFEPNWSTISTFLLKSQLEQSVNTFFRGIEQVAAGTAFELDLKGNLNEWRYWSVEQVPEQQIDRPDEEFAALFEDAVRLHMRSDVPVGVHLSGGLDSTSIICAAARQCKAAERNLHIMAFSYIDPEYDESQYIAATIEETKAELKKLNTNPLALWEMIEKVLWYQDEPVHSMTAIVGYELMKLASTNGIKVILNGQGADETIAGYPNYFRDYWYTLLHSGHIRKAWNEIGTYAKSHDAGTQELFLKQVRHFLQSHLRRIHLYRILAYSRKRRLFQHNPWFGEHLLKQLPQESISYEDRSLNASLTRSVESSPLPLFLRVEDRNSMAHSVEVRLPFLDYRLVSFLFNLRLDWKMRGPWNKFILRQAMRGRIPEQVRTRVDKMGFPTAMNRWFKEDLYEPLRDLLSSQATKERGIYNTKSIVKDLERHRRGEVDISKALFNVAQMELWFQNQEGSSILKTANRIGSESS